MNEEFGTETIEAPIDGWMMAADPKNPEAAKELLFFLGTAAAQEAYLAVDPSVIGAAKDIDTSIFTPLQQKVARGGLRGRRPSPSSWTATPARSSPPTSPVRRSRTSCPIHPASTGSSKTCRPRPRPSSRSSVERARRNQCGGRVSLSHRSGGSLGNRGPGSEPARSRGRSRRPAASGSSTAATAGSCWRWLGIPTILHVALVWIPTIASILLSFTDWKGIRFSDMNWVGFKNYEQIFTAFRRNFFQALINNSVLLIFLFIGPTALGIVLAYMLDRDIRGTRFFQGVFFTPVVLSLAVVGFMWQSVIYSTENGLATQLFGGGKSGRLARQSVVLDSHSASYGVSANFVAILVAIAWRHTGYIMVLYLAGLKSVDSSLREAAMLDGSNEWQVFRHVVFPSLKPINVVVAVITVIEALRAFDIIFVLNIPRKTEVLSILTTNNLLGEGGGNVGRGSAYATILFVLCFGFVIWYVTNHYRQHAGRSRRVSAATAAPAATTVDRRRL